MPPKVLVIGPIDPVFKAFDTFIPLVFFVMVLAVFLSVKAFILLVFELLEECIYECGVEQTKNVAQNADDYK